MTYAHAGTQSATLPYLTLHISSASRSVGIIRQLSEASSYPVGPQDACLAPWQRASHARGAWASEEKSLWEVARILTGRYSYAHADGGTHAGACLLPRTVDPIRICPVAAKQPPGRQQRHHHHLRVTQRLSSQSYQPGHLTQDGVCTSGPPWVCAAPNGVGILVSDRVGRLAVPRLRSVY